MRTDLRTVQQALSLPGLPEPEPVRVRLAEAGEVHGVR